MNSASLTWTARIKICVPTKCFPIEKLVNASCRSAAYGVIIIKTHNYDGIARLYLLVFSPLLTNGNWRTVTHCIRPRYWSGALWKMTQLDGKQRIRNWSLRCVFAMTALLLFFKSVLRTFFPYHASIKYFGSVSVPWESLRRSQNSTPVAYLEDKCDTRRQCSSRDAPLVLFWAGRSSIWVRWKHSSRLKKRNRKNKLEFTVDDNRQYLSIWSSSMKHRRNGGSGGD